MRRNEFCYEVEMLFKNNLCRKETREEWTELCETITEMVGSPINLYDHRAGNVIFNQLSLKGIDIPAHLRDWYYKPRTESALFKINYSLMTFISNVKTRIYSDDFENMIKYFNNLIK